MSENIFVIDTHILVWFLTGDRRLSDKVKRILRKAEQGKVNCLIPTIVLAELEYIVTKGKIKVNMKNTIKKLKKTGGFIIVPFDFNIFEEMLNINSDLEIHDRIIMATARIYKGVLITQDHKIIKSGKVNVFSI